MRKKFSRYHFVLVTIFISALLHAVPVSYLVLNSPSVTKQTHGSEVELNVALHDLKHQTKSQTQNESARKGLRALRNILRGAVPEVSTDRFPDDPMSAVRDFAQGW